MAFPDHCLPPIGTPVPEGKETVLSELRKK
jgi:hypothetical protein